MSVRGYVHTPCRVCQLTDLLYDKKEYNGGELSHK